VEDLPCRQAGGMTQLSIFGGLAIFKGHFIKVKNLDKDKKIKSHKFTNKF
jgi:hypothetical protein